MVGGPDTIHGFKNLGRVIVNDFFKGDGGEARQRRAFNCLEGGVVMHEDFAGRQGMTIGVAMALQDMKEMGLASDGLFVYRTSESSPNKRRLIEESQLKPNCSYSDVKKKNLRGTDLWFIDKEKPKFDVIPDSMRALYHHQLNQHFRRNKALSKSRR